MAIIDYKEKYEKAVQAAMLAKQDTESAVTIGILEEIFPELRESEGERIRKEMITYFSTVEDKELIPYESWIAYLEKQGEQKPVVIIPKFRIGDSIKTTNEEPLTITKITDSGYWSEDLFICGFDEVAKWELVEQKPAEWSKDDKIWIDRACMLLDELNHLSTLTLAKIPSNVNDIISHLKSLEDRVQPKQEWSEEDEKMIRGLIVICDEWTTRHSFYPIENCEIEKLKNWLKSIKDRYTWKPSDEQMSVIEAVINNRSFQRRLLVSLYEQLKKLRKE